MSDEKKQCSAKVFNGWRFHGCEKPAKVERKSRWYCTIHDPERVARKQAERLQRREKELAAWHERCARDSAISRAVHDLTTEELKQVTPNMIREAIRRSEGKVN